MGAGEDFKYAFKDLLRELGQTIIVHNQWGQPDSTSFEVRGLKNNEKGKTQNVMFQFPERIDIRIGSVLQLKAGRDLWKVFDIEDIVVADTFIHFDAKVVKISSDGKEIKDKSPQAVFNAPVYGGVQVGGEQNVQQISIDSQSDVSELVKKLVDLINSSSLPILQKEDAIEAINRLPQLATKEQNEEVLRRVKTRLDLVKDSIEIGKDLAPIAFPILMALYKLFGIG